ncbi:MAG: GNAT family N-acetyltransferase [Lachnospiraceae bacterium]|nr:GNAT family N-acetyltransferase [Lachnospiraceae bacterium]MDE7203593.1 GNAT family N-acetyltransferase [Lachnospiraceae bacterium]
MIRKAVSQDIDQIENSYTELLLYEMEHGAYTVWQLGVYPTRSTAEKALFEDTLYVMEEDGEICASIIANKVQPEEYERVCWKYQAGPDEVLVIYLLCVRPSKAGHGIGSELVQFVIKKAKSMNCKSVRLDTGSQNKPAVALYTKLGFELAGTGTMAIGGVISHRNHLFYEKKV